MNRFEKVSPEQWARDSAGRIAASWDDIRLPERKTRWAAGYDFYSPVTAAITPGQTVMVPTGIRCGLDLDCMLLITPRSGLATKCGITLANTVGIIDGDYYMNEDNEGHILLALHNSSNEPQVISIGDRVAQGIILKYHTAYGAFIGDEERRGGFGSTGI